MTDLLSDLRFHAASGDFDLDAVHEQEQHMVGVPVATMSYSASALARICLHQVLCLAHSSVSLAFTPHTCCV